MNFWIDAQLPPNLANWLVESFNVNATAIRDLG
jgi:predicted nuclease of predicted toxin-antitoxin system